MKTNLKLSAKKENPSNIHKLNPRMGDKFTSSATHRDVLFEFHLKFWNTASIGIPVRSLLKSDRLLTGLTARWYSNKTSL